MHIVRLSDEHDLAGFSCGDEAMDRWLVTNALSNQKQLVSMTYLGISDERTIGFYTLTMESVEPRDAPEIASRGPPPARPIPVFLLARLGVTQDEQDRKIGTRLVLDAIRRSVAAAEIVGGRAIVVDCQDKDLEEWYGRLGFRPLSARPGRVFLRTKDAKRTLE